MWRRNVVTMKRNFLTLRQRIQLFSFISWQKIKKERTRLKLRRRGSFSQSTLISLVMRPFLEKKQIRSYLMAPILASMIAGSGYMTDYNSTSQALSSIENPEQFLSISLESTETIRSDPYYKLPAPNLLGISQYYQAGHPALDLRANYGSPVVAMERGHVSQVTYDRFGYGRHIIVDHKDDIVTVYAHLELILVEPNQLVEAGEIIGTVGMTGWTTGPHVHFEVRENGVQINPLPYIKPAIEERNKE